MSWAEEFIETLPKVEPKQRKEILSAPVPTPCDQCKGQCCTADFGWVYLKLEEDELHLFPREDITNKSVFFVEPMWGYYLKNGCLHLKDGKCSIYNNRPKACREFDCVQYYVNDSDRLFRNMEAGTKDFMETLMRNAVDEKQF